MHDASPVLQLNNVSRVFVRGGVRAVDRVSLDVFAGEILSILGPSGCGKTTTMRMIAGLDEPTGGDVRIFGRSVLGIPPHRRKIGLVFQSLAIFPHMTVKQNVAFGLRMQHVSRSMIEERVARLLRLVQLPPEEFAERYPGQLSGGQLQRVALARTLVTEPALVLFDEPMAALDRRLRDHMAVELRAIQKELGIAAVYVTHDQETASTMSDRIAIMDSGRIVQVGTPAEVYERPASRFVAGFLGDANFLEPDSVGAREGECRMVEILGAPVQVIDAHQADAGEPVVMLRPDHLQLHTQRPEQPALKGAIVGLQFAGGFYRWQVKLADGRLVVARSNERLADAGPEGDVWLSVRSHTARLLRQ